MFYFFQQRRSRDPASSWESDFSLRAARGWQGSAVPKTGLTGGKINTNRQLFMVVKVWDFPFHH